MSGLMSDFDADYMLGTSQSDPSERALVLADNSAVYWRTYFAPSMKDGVRAASFVLNRYEKWSEHNDVVACQDSKESLRKDIYPEYKAKRKADDRPADAWEGLRWLESRLPDLGIPIAGADGYEADDIQATLASQSAPRRTLIVSGDKDLVPTLVYDHVTLVEYDGTMRTAADMVRKFNVPIAKFSQWLAIVGDAVDNIQGCPRVGPGKATQLLQEFGTIPGIKLASKEQLIALKGIGEKVADAILEWEPRLAQELVALRYDAPVKLEELLKGEVAF